MMIIKKQPFISALAVLLTASYVYALPSPEIIVPVSSHSSNGSTTYRIVGKGNITRDFGYPPHGIFELPEPVYPDMLEVLEWERNEECASSYFRTTTENRNASAHLTHYWLWTQQQAQQNGEEYLLEGETPLFYQQHFASSWDFHCSTHQGGCKRQYTCEEIVRATKARNRGMGTHELLELSRKLYFKVVDDHNMAHNLNYVHNLMTVVQLNAFGNINKIVDTFTRKPDELADAVCALVKDGINTAIDILATVLALIPLPGMPLVGMGVKMGSGMVNGILAADTGAIIYDGEEYWDAPEDQDVYVDALEQQPSDNVESSFGEDLRDNAIAAIPALVNTAVSTGISLYKMIKKYKRATEVGITDNGHGIPGMRNPKQANGLCGALGGDIADQSIERQNAIVHFVTLNSMNIRAGVSDLMELAFNGDVQNGVAGSVLANMLASSEFTKLKRNSGKDETAATNAYVESLTAKVWQNHKCFQQCTKDTVPSMCDGKSQAEKIKHQWCNNGRVCQVACVSIKDHNNYLMPIYGFESVPKQFNATLEEVGEWSRDHFLQNGRDNLNKESPMANFVGSVLNDQEPTRNLNLPHCESDQLRLGDIRNKKLANGQLRPEFKHVPCTCGDWTSNGTANFMTAMGMDPESTTYQEFATLHTKNTYGREYFQHFCPWQISKLPPMNNYLAMCELNIRVVPDTRKSDNTYKEDKGLITWKYRAHPGRDKYCDAITAKAAEFKSQLDANLWFCTESLEAKDIFNYQVGHLRVKQPRKHNKIMLIKKLDAHKKRCSKWIKAYRQFEKFGNSNNMEGLEYGEEVEGMEDLGDEDLD